MTQQQERVLAIASQLSATGLGLHLNDSGHARELTAARHVCGLQDIEIILDQDGYFELRCWTSPDATSIQIAAAVNQAVAAVSPVCAPALTASQARTRPVAGYDGAVTDCTGDGGMPGPQDQVVKPMPPADQVPQGQPDAPREGTRPAETDFQERLNRLRPNHPSSPHRDDGSRKAFRPGDSVDELSHPDEMMSRTEPVQEKVSVSKDQPDQSLEAQDKTRIDADGSWHWRGRELLAERSRVADRAIQRCREAEGRDLNGNYGGHGLTPAMSRVQVDLEYGRLIEDTEKYALKSPDRFKEKLAKLASDEPDCDMQELASRINDGIRYTFRFPDDRYSSGVMRLCDVMTAAGFEPYERKNAWADHTKSYRGINSTWLDPDSGLRFEVQMHTQASWAAKQESHREYEVIESVSTTPEEKMEARDRQDRIFALVPIPPNALEIPTYRREGW